MSSGFEKPITIREAIENIDTRTYLLPAIQRPYVWSSKQVDLNPPPDFSSPSEPP